MNTESAARKTSILEIRFGIVYACAFSRYKQIGLYAVLNNKIYILSLYNKVDLRYVFFFFHHLNFRQTQQKFFKLCIGRVLRDPWNIYTNTDRDLISSRSAHGVLTCNPIVSQMLSAHFLTHLN